MKDKSHHTRLRKAVRQLKDLGFDISMKSIFRKQGKATVLSTVLSGEAAHKDGKLGIDLDDCGRLVRLMEKPFGFASAPYVCCTQEEFKARELGVQIYRTHEQVRIQRAQARENDDILKKPRIPNCCEAVNAGVRMLSRRDMETQARLLANARWSLSDLDGKSVAIAAPAYKGGDKQMRFMVGPGYNRFVGREGIGAALTRKGIAIILDARREPSPILDEKGIRKYHCVGFQMNKASKTYTVEDLRVYAGYGLVVADPNPNTAFEFFNKVFAERSTEFMQDGK